MSFALIGREEGLWEMIYICEGFREDFTKDLACEGRFEDQVRVCQERKSLGRIQQRMTGCAEKWQQGKAQWAMGTGRRLAWPGGRRVGICG